MSEPEKSGGKSVRNPAFGSRLRVALQVCHRRARLCREYSRVQTVGAQIRQAEYQQALLRMEALADPMTLRDFEVASSAHDALPARHDRGF